MQKTLYFVSLSFLPLMKKIFLSFLLVAALCSASAQDFVNKIGIRTVTNNTPFELSYVENTDDEEGEPITNLYLKYLPGPNFREYSNCWDWSLLRIVDKRTGRSYKIIDGGGISLREDASFAFHNKGGEVGFSLSFEQIPSTARSFDLLWDDVPYFKDIAIDPERDDDNSVFRFQHIFRTVAFYSNASTKVYFTIDGLERSLFSIHTPYLAGSRPKGCGAAGTMTFGYSPSVAGREVRIVAKTTNSDGTTSTWEMTETPNVTCQYTFVRKS